jgi:type I restriction-modification system, S subunit
MKNEIKQQLISGDSRNGDWKRCLFSDKFERITRKNKDGNRNVLTISAQQGLINQFEYYNHQYASEDTSSYTLLKRGDFAYNKSYSDGYPWGALKRLERYDSGIVSPLYICFAPKNGVCSDFYKQYFEAGLFNREIYKIAQEGARNHGLLNVSTEDFFNAMLADPPIEEQRKIAEILGCCDEVIRLKKELIAEKKKQKKALMQKLLDPNSGFRLPGFSGNWTAIQLYECGQWYGGGTPSKKNSSFWKNGSIKWISSQEVKNKLITDTTFKITPLAILASTTNLVPQNSLIFVTRSGILRNSFPISRIQETMAINQDIKALHPKKDIDSFFLQCLLEAQEDYILKNYIKAGTTVESLMLNSFQQMMLQIPAIPEQLALADIFRCSNTEIDLLEQELSEQEKKKKSLMQLFLTGIVRV